MIDTYLIFWSGMRNRLIVGAIFAATATAPCVAQTTAGSGSVIVVPIVAQTTSYNSEILVRNPNSAPISVNVNFYEALTSAIPGQVSCTPLVVPAFLTVSFTLPGQCSLGAGNHHGLLILENAASEKTDVFYAYSRSQTPGGNGFSVEGFPIGNFSGAPSDVIGLKREAAAPTYQTNCFVAALGEPITYQILLRNGTTNNLIGSNTMSNTLQPYQMYRHLDVFAPTNANAPAGDYTNVRANFSVTNVNKPAYVGFCTVQESTFFGADFRIAKSEDALDNRQKRLTCFAQDSCGTTSTINPATVDDVTQKNIHWLIIAQPDYVKCELVSTRLSDLQIQLRGPGDVFDAPVFATSPPYSSGGTGSTSFYIQTPQRGNALTNGIDTRWFIDVAFRQGGSSTVPIPYGITCRSGNGVSVPWFRASCPTDSNGACQ